MGYFRVRFRGGTSDKHWIDWLEKINGELQSCHVDHASPNLRVVRTSMAAQDLLRFCSQSKNGRSFNRKVEVQEITRDNASDPIMVSCVEAIQRFFGDFLDINYH